MSLHRHHRKLRSQGGGDEPANILILPQELHNWIHDNPEKARELGWIVPGHANPEDVSVTIPEELAKIVKRNREREKTEAPRKRTVVSVRVPKDEHENGAEVLESLIGQARERLAPEMNWKEDVPPYFVLVAVLYDWLASGGQG